ncbi:MAG TPA: hypothetical protein VNK41_02170 [Vicinamibacterales bacterium]|nr:hypothetical protein [Vicinamibacterales bacterium]
MSPLFAQTPPAGSPPPAGTQQPQSDQQQQQQQTSALTFEGDAGMLLMQVKPDKTADFEAVIGRLHEALQKSDKPERRQQAQGWKIFRSTDPGPGGNVLYVAIMDPVLKGADYTIAMILYEVFPTEVQQIFPAFRDSFAAGLNKVNLSLVQDFGGPARPAPQLPSAGSSQGTPGTPGETGAAGTTGSESPSSSDPQPQTPQDPQ